MAKGQKMSTHVQHINETSKNNVTHMQYSTYAWVAMWCSAIKLPVASTVQYRKIYKENYPIVNYIILIL